MSESIKERCRRILVEHAIPDPDGRILMAMVEAYLSGAASKE